MPLERFHQAQADAHSGYPTALAEIRAGRKRSHWIWYIFPQLKGLGLSSMAQTYALSRREEACDFLCDPVLGARYAEITGAVKQQMEKGVPLESLMGGRTDALKLVSSLTLFQIAATHLADGPLSAVPEDFVKASRMVLAFAETQGYSHCEFTCAQLEKKA